MMWFGLATILLAVLLGMFIMFLIFCFLVVMSTAISGINDFEKDDSDLDED